MFVSTMQHIVGDNTTTVGFIGRECNVVSYRSSHRTAQIRHYNLRLPRFFKRKAECKSFGMLNDKTRFSNDSCPRISREPLVFFWMLKFARWFSNITLMPTFIIQSPFLPNIKNSSNSSYNPLHLIQNY